VRKIFAVILSTVMIIGCSSAVFAADTEKYILNVNCTQNIVTVYENDGSGMYAPIKAFVCSVGNDTPCGTFKTSDKYTWRLLFGNVYGQYATRITGHILFHSVPYYTKNKDDLEYNEYNKLGSTASMGCIRLSVMDAKWIYDNCPSGTTVKIYKSEASEPIKKPSVITIEVNDIEKRGWDPTDPDVSNPWRVMAEIDNTETQQAKNENTTETVKVNLNGKELSLEAFKSDDGQYYFLGSDIEYALSLDGKNISFSNSGNIVYIKNVSSAYTQKGIKKEFSSAEKGSIAVAFGNVCKQINTYNIDSSMYFSFSEIASLLGYIQTNNNSLSESTK